MMIMAWWWLGFSQLVVNLASARMRFSVSSRLGQVRQAFLSLGYGGQIFGGEPSDLHRSGSQAQKAKAKGRAQVRATLQEPGRKGKKGNGKGKAPDARPKMAAGPA